MAEVVTLAEAARQLRVSTRTARRWVKAGSLPAALGPGTNGPQYFVPAEAVEERRAVKQRAARPLLPAAIEEAPPDATGAAWRELTRAQQELWRTCQELSRVTEEMRRLREELAETRRAIRAERAARAGSGAGSEA
jgi:excisionase family DNA binding protein